MPRTLPILAAIPAALTAAALFTYALLTTASNFLFLSRHEPADPKLLLLAAVFALLGYACLRAALCVRRSRLAAAACLLVALSLLVTGAFEIGKLATAPHPPSIHRQRGLTFLVVALPSTLLGLTGLLGALPLCLRKHPAAPASPIAQTGR